MSNWLHDLYDTMKRSEKEMLIRRSGSTPEGKNEKIRSARDRMKRYYSKVRRGPPGKEDKRTGETWPYQLWIPSD